MNLVTISKKISGAKDDLVVLPRKEYESLKARAIPEAPMTAGEKRALARARKALKEGTLLTLDEFRTKMGRPRRAGRR